MEQIIMLLILPKSEGVNAPCPPVSDAPDWSLSLVPRFDDSFLNNKAGNVQNNSSRNLIDKYLAHVIEQPNFRIPNPQYFVYLLDQTVGGRDTLQFIYWNHATFSTSF